MTLEEIVECINKHLHNKRKQLKLNNNEFLVLHRSSKQNTQFKVYKEYTIILWLIKLSEKIPVLLVNHVARVTDGNEEEVKNLIDKEVVEKIINLVHSNLYTKIIEGTYTGYNE